MQRIYKTGVGFSIVSLLVAALLPMQTSAEVSVQCMALGAKRQEVKQTMQPKLTDVANLRVKDKFSLPQAKNVAQKKIDTFRQAADKKRKDTYQKLNAKLKTVKQKTAFFQYQKDVTAAIASYRKSDDAARSSYDKGINSLFAQHRTSVDQGFKALNSRYDKAFNDAVKLCQKVGVEKATAQLKTDVAKAEEVFIETPFISPDDLAVLSKNLSDKEQAANQAADQKFSVALQAARVKFGKAFDFSKDTKNIFEPSKL